MGLLLLHGAHAECKFEERRSVFPAFGEALQLAIEPLVEQALVACCSKEKLRFQCKERMAMPQAFEFAGCNLDEQLTVTLTFIRIKPDGGHTALAGSFSVEQCTVEAIENAVQHAPEVKLAERKLLFLRWTKP